MKKYFLQASVHLILLSSPVILPAGNDPYFEQKIAISKLVSIGTNKDKNELACLIDKLYLGNKEISGWRVFRDWHNEIIKSMGRFSLPWINDRGEPRNANILAAKIGIVFEHTNNDSMGLLEIIPIDVPRYFISGKYVPPRTKEGFQVTEKESFILPDFHKDQLDKEIEKEKQKHLLKIEKENEKFLNFKREREKLTKECDEKKLSKSSIEEQLNNPETTTHQKLKNLNNSLKKTTTRINEIEAQLKEQNEKDQEKLKDECFKRINEEGSKALKKLQTDYIAKHLLIDISDSLIECYGATSPTAKDRAGYLYQNILGTMLKSLTAIKDQLPEPKTIDIVSSAIIDSGIEKYRIFESEHGLFAYLSNLKKTQLEETNENKKMLRALNKEIKEGLIKIKAVIINVASKKDTCQDCSLFYLSHSLFEKNGGKNAFEDSKPEGIDTSSWRSFNILKSIRSLLGVKEDNIDLYFIISSFTNGVTKNGIKKSALFDMEISNKCHKCASEGQCNTNDTEDCKLCAVDSPIKSDSPLRFYMRKFKWGN